MPDGSLPTLDRLPTVPLGHFPTPLEMLEPLGEEFGIRLGLKREDLSGLLLGGNKVRKLELVLADEAAQTATVYLTTGGTQSNHARETAAAAARLGRGAVLFLRGDRPRQNVNGNLRLFDVLGATVHFLGDASYEKGEAEMERVAAELRSAGQRPYVIPMGASSWRGVAAWARAWSELAVQAEESLGGVDHVVLAAGTGSTAVGLAMGAALAGSSAKVWGVSVSWSAEALALETGRLLREVSNHLDVSAAALSNVMQRLHWDDGYVGAGYTYPTDGGRRAVQLLARRAGVLADLTYSGKGFAGLIGAVRREEISPGERVVFVHTGGAVELFNRPLEDLTDDFDAVPEGGGRLQLNRPG